MKDDLTSSVTIFVTTAVCVVALIQRKQRRTQNSYHTQHPSNGSSLSQPWLSKQDVLQLRTKHFLKSVSVSYANTGGLMILKGNGSRLYDERGTSYLDTRNNVCHVGHCNPRVVDAVSRQLAELNTNTRYLHPTVIRLAQRLADKCPDPLQVVVFVNSGSEANDLALRLARAYTKSKNTIVVEGAYHGHTLAVLEVSPYKYQHSKEFDLQLQEEETTKGPVTTPGPHIWQVPCPDMYRQRHNTGKEYANHVQDGCDYFQRKGESTGAIIMEGGMSVGGVILPSDDFVRDSVTAVRNHGGVYIADEVQTGFGRLGSSFWAFQHGNHGIVPDIVTVGKPFGNGMSLGAVVTTPEIAKAFDSMGVEYFNTFGGNPVAAAAGMAMFDVLEDEKLQEHALQIGGYLKKRFWEIQTERLHQDLIGDIRGSGLFLGIDIVESSTLRTPAAAKTSFICSRLKQQYNILTSIDGLYDNVLVIKPPMVFSKEDADFL
ncbi:aminotransferase class-III [Nitzschia inconspicua]|uniref:Aminotransferase class-III n=1 Tax=Nitzschia inconspicua TaxID=303405 RepID=A0A9K3LBF7_9STRA|nr:aminotransferase class-III [Nitzschia inconspicua]